MLAGHFDSVPPGPGASDDGAAVAAILEIARMLRDQPPSRNDVILLFTDGEELGMYRRPGVYAGQSLGQRRGGGH